MREQEEKGREKGERKDKEGEERLKKGWEKGEGDTLSTLQTRPSRA